MQLQKLKKGVQTAGKVCVALILLCVFFSEASARVCFLPGGRCLNEFMVAGGRAVQSVSCDGYNLTQIKCENKACEIGWDCESCTNAQGTFYKCTKKPTPEGYTPGLEKCSSSCQKYTWEGFTGNQINGRCEDLEGYTSIKPNPCSTYIIPDYTCGVNIEGTEIKELTKDNGDCSVCYANIIAMSGYTATKPTSCTTYTSKRDGLGTDQDVMCYTDGQSIGTYFSTTERDDNVFVVETKYGKDNGENTEACYRAIGCNAANGWMPEDQIDGSTFVYSEHSSDGITCRKAHACAVGNNWYPYEDIGNYKDTYFTMETETKSGLTCYRVTGCHAKAYASEPDTTYFKSDKKTSNGNNCWIVTGISDYAYESKELSKFFEYETKTAYLNGTEETVTYHRIKDCAQYAYTSQPDDKYFTSDSHTRKKLGTNENITCWNTTGCGAYSYTSEPDSLYFTSDSMSGKKNGNNTDFTCWVASGCASGASATSQDTNIYMVADNELHANGTNDVIKCYRAIGCENTKGYYNHCTAEDCSLTGYKTTCGNANMASGISCYLKTENVACACTEGGLYAESQATSCNSTGYKTTSVATTYGGNTCYDKTENVACTCAEGNYQTASLNHTCAQSPVGYKRTNSTGVTYGGKTCYVTGSNTQCECSEGGYYTSNQNYNCENFPRGYKNTTSTTTTYGDKTCYTAGSKTQCTCAEGGYIDNCTESCASSSTVNSCHYQRYGDRDCWFKNVYYCNSDQTCSGGVCQYGDCGCGSQKWCSVVSFTGTCSGSSVPTSYGSGGSCRDASTGRYGTISGLGNVYYSTDGTLNWWSAYNYCKSIGKSMVTRSQATANSVTPMRNYGLKNVWLGDAVSGCYAYNENLNDGNTQTLLRYNYGPDYGTTFNALCVDYNCTSNSNCGSGQYCKIYNGYTTSGDCDASNTNYFTSVKGSCEFIGNKRSATVNGVSIIFSELGSFNWWSAKNWCASQGKRLYTYSEANSNLSALSSFFMNNYGFSFAWTWASDSYPTSLGENGCFAYSVSFYNTTIGYQQRSGGAYNSFPVCR